MKYIYRYKNYIYICDKSSKTLILIFLYDVNIRSPKVWLRMQGSNLGADLEFLHISSRMMNKCYDYAISSLQTLYIYLHLSHASHSLRMASGNTSHKIDKHDQQFAPVYLCNKRVCTLYYHVDSSILVSRNTIHTDKPFTPVKSTVLQLLNHVCSYSIPVRFPGTYPLNAMSAFC